MRSRFLHAVTALFVFVGIAAAEPPKPAIVAQAKPVSRLLIEYKEIVKQVGGPQGEAFVKEFERDLKNSLGEKGLEGIDINRPLAAYSMLKDKQEDCGLALVVPITSEKEFLDLLGRLKIKYEEVKDKKGLYSIEVPNGPFTKNSHLRITEGGWAYFTLNDGDPTDAKDLVPIGDLLDNADASLFSVKVFPGRLPAKLVKSLLDEIDNTAGQIKGFLGAGPGPEAKIFGAILEHGPKLHRRYVETGMKEANEVGVKFSFDPMTGDTLTELTLVPKAGTNLAKEIAATPPTSNRFAGLATKDAAGAIIVKAPLFATELREIGGSVAEGFEALFKADNDIPEKIQPVIAEVLKGVGRQAKAGDLDAAVVLHGPNKDGKFTLLLAASFDDPAALEKALRQAAKDSGFAKEFKLDAVKVGDASVHEVPLLRLFPDEAHDELAKVFGDKPPGALAATKGAIFLAFGPDAVNVVKAALETKPAPAPVVDVTGNMSRLQKLMAALDPMSGMMFAKYLGNADKSVTALRVTVEGGDKLTAKVTLNVRYLPKILLGETTNEMFKQVK